MTIKKNILIIIDDILVSDEIIQKQFVCDLNKCKGACCEEGDAGAPLTHEETEILNETYEQIRPYLSAEGIKEIEKTGRYQYNRSFGWVTPTIEGKLCAYGTKDSRGVIHCGIEQAFMDGKISWKKPISCHLFPITTKKTEHHELVNYEPRESLCDPACAFGRKLKVPVYVFLKDALVRKFGATFYDTLDNVASECHGVPDEQ